MSFKTLVVLLALVTVLGSAQATGTYGGNTPTVTPGTYGDHGASSGYGYGYGGHQPSGKGPTLVIDMEPPEFVLPTSLVASNSNATTVALISDANATATPTGSNGGAGARVAAGALAGAALLAALLA